jgi:phosphate/sulfate permease
LIGAIIWNLITWFYGIPSSSSHALIGGYAGAAIAKAGWAAIEWGTKWIQTLSFIVISPAVGCMAGFILMVIVYWVSENGAGARRSFLQSAQLASSAALSLAHGGNDAQKTMGIIVGCLVSVKPCSQPRRDSGITSISHRRCSALGRDGRVHGDLARNVVRRLAYRAHDGITNHPSCVRQRVLR